MYKIGIRPAIDRCQGSIRASQEKETWDLANTVADYIRGNVKDRFGEPGRMCAGGYNDRQCCGSGHVRRENGAARRLYFNHGDAFVVLSDRGHGYGPVITESDLGS